jgi:hypothetical protein
VVAQAEHLLTEAVAARRAGRRSARERARAHHVLLSRGLAARDAAGTPAGRVRRTIRKAQR